MRFLFLGNSLMYYNDMPKIFESLAKAAGKNVFVDSITKGSATISDFAHPTTEVGARAHKKLTEEKWDYVIIEPSRRINPWDSTVMRAETASAGIIYDSIRGNNTKLLLYSVWGNNNGMVVEYTASSPTEITKVADHSMSRRNHTKFMHNVNTEIAEHLQITDNVVKAGYAFENSIHTYPEVELYDPDMRHPSLEGSYLAACTFYCTVFDERVNGNSYTASSPHATKMQQIADATVMDGTVPDLSEEDSEKETFNLLIIGSKLMDNYSMHTPFSVMVDKVYGKDVNAKYLMSSTFVANDLVDPNDDLGLRGTLVSEKWDAIVVQLTRRCTISAADVEASELNALRTVMPLLLEETDKVFIFTLDSSKNPSIFTTAQGDPGYTDTGRKESCSALEGSEYFAETAKKFANELGCHTILYGSAYHEYEDHDKNSRAYMQGCMLFCSIFGASLPEYTPSGLSETQAAAIRKTVEKYSLDGQ